MLEIADKAKLNEICHSLKNIENLLVNINKSIQNVNTINVGDIHVGSNVSDINDIAIQVMKIIGETAKRRMNNANS